MATEMVHIRLPVDALNLMGEIIEKIQTRSTGSGLLYAGIAQLVEHLPSKQGVAGSRPVAGSRGWWPRLFISFSFQWRPGTRREVPIGVGNLEERS